MIKQLPPATLDEHVTGKLGPQEAEWEPPCRLVTHRVRKLAFKLLSYKVCTGNQIIRSAYQTCNLSFTEIES